MRQPHGFATIRVFSRPSRPCSKPIRSAPASRTCANASNRSGGIFDYPAKRERLEEVSRELESPNVWDDPQRAQDLGRERARLGEFVEGLDSIGHGLDDADELLELSAAEGDEASVQAVAHDVDALETKVGKLEFQRMFSGEMDAANAFVDIQAGAGGTEAQDWASMLLRMYLRWAEDRGWQTEMMEESEGEVAGIKSATFRVAGDYAYGWLKTEIGVHRLVRKSPFDSDNRRHTSFASIFVSPEVDDDIDIEINPADLKTDVYRSSGAGGQHANRDRAMKMLKAKLYEMEVQKRNAEKDKLEATKSDIGWGSQIRNYVLDQSRSKDLRTGIERTDTQKVLDGDLDGFN